MQRFSFQLESVLGWRQTQFDLEEAKLRKLFAERGAIEAQGAALERSEAASRDSVKNASAAPAERAALDEYLHWVRREQARVAAMMVECDRWIEIQRAQVLEARRKCELLKKLKERRYTEWNAQFQKELEQLAADAHLAKLTRG